MASPVDIVNRALAECGARSSIASFDEGSAESLQAKIWYDTSRRQLLRAAPWGFARYQAVLSLLGSALNDPPDSIYPWPFKYLYPPECLRVRYILPPTPTTSTQVVGLQEAFTGWLGPSRNNRFLIANDDGVGGQRRVVLTTVCEAQAVFIRDVTDVDLMDDEFQGALSAVLAARFVIPLSGNVQMRPQFIQSAQDAIIQARVADGNEALPTTDHVPDWIAARGLWAPDWAVGFPLAGMGLWNVGWTDLNWGS